MKKLTNTNDSEQEIIGSLFLVNSCLKVLGISLEHRPKSKLDDLVQKFKLYSFAFTICYHTVSDFIYISTIVKNGFTFEGIIPYVHLIGYGYLSVIKLYTIWSKRYIYGKLIRELIEIWPVIALDPQSTAIKENKLKILRIQHIGYCISSIIGVVFYSITPILLYIMERSMGQDTKLGFIWACWYPFDKYSTLGHTVVYIFEIIVGCTCILITLSSELLFTAFANHMGVLLRCLHIRLHNMGYKGPGINYQQEIIHNIKLHQRLIEYCGDIEEAFTLMNFNNMVISSISICCLSFIIIVLEPIFFISNKLFLSIFSVQIFLLCWYSDDVYYANANVATAAYSSKWYNLDIQSRKMLVLLMCRAQKPLGFTTLKFTIITLSTFSSIMSKSYSYFTLLYTMYTNEEDQQI